MGKKGPSETVTKPGTECSFFNEVIISNPNLKKITSSVYDCTVEDVE